MKKIILLLISLLLLTGESTVAQEFQELDFDLEGLGLEIEEAGGEYHFSEMKPEFVLSLGYGFSDFNDSKIALEYEDLKNYPVMHGSYESHNYPHRMHFDLNMKNDNDYFADMRYSFKSNVNIWILNSTLFHNLSNIGLVDLDPAMNASTVDIQDSNEMYDVRTGINRFKMKFKKRDFPVHLYVNGSIVYQDGTRQQRSLLGSGYFTPMQRTTQKREIDQITHIYDIGVNSHLGYMEVDYSHVEKRFDVNNDGVMFDSYSTGKGGLRLAGVYPHNKFSELKSSSNKIKLHTSYTGKIVATATFSKKKRENMYSDAKEDISHAQGSLAWTPLTRLAFFLKYSHRDIDADNPGISSITDNMGNTTIFPLPVKNSISSTTDTVSLTSRYKPEKGVTLKAKYAYKRIDRDNHELWELQDSTEKSTITFSAAVRLLKSMTAKARYIHSEVNKPSYNFEPYYSNKGTASVSWIPIPRVSLLAHYSVAREKRNDLVITDAPNATASDRDVDMDNYLGSGTFQILSNLSLTTSYAYMRYKVTQDIVYFMGSDLTESGVPMEDEAQIYSATFNYIPLEKLVLNAGITHTKSTGGYTPVSQDLTSTVSIASFSEHEVKETVYHLSGDYECPKGFSCGLDFKYSEFNDVLNNIYNSDQDGDAYSIIVRIKKLWG